MIKVKVEMHPELKALAEARSVAAGAVRAANKAYDEVCLRLINESLPKNIEELIEQGTVIPFTLDALYMPRAWNCRRSPTRHCVYSASDEDTCLYCGKPCERQ